MPTLLYQLLTLYVRLLDSLRREIGQTPISVRSLTPGQAMQQIPLIDISGFDSRDPGMRRRVAREWDEALQLWGFATIVGHGVPEALIEQIHAEGLKFFDCPLEEKKRFSFPGAPRSQGFVPMGAEIIAATMGRPTPADICESLTFSSLHWDQQPSPNAFDRSVHRENLWPSDMADFRRLVRQYHAAIYELVVKLMRISAISLGLDEDFFEAYFDRMPTNLRFVDYPHQTVAPMPRQLRYGAHTDFTGFTVLRQDDAPGGLQVRGPNRQWVDVTPRQGAFVVNSGDLIQRWTNDRWVSNVHRVVNPPMDASASTRRLSIVFFSNPNHDAEIRALPNCVTTGSTGKHPPVMAWDHLMGKVRRSIPQDL
jgi:isopenicillin N synthase-like dioxygenase